jgi:ferredoxin-NADP reductase
MLTDMLAGLGTAPLVYICGPTLLVEAAAAGVTDLGVTPARVRTERFGPTT